MKQDPSFRDYVVQDLLEGIPGIGSRAMFGGWGIYKDGVIFAIIVDGALYFKVDESNRADFERLESRPFVYSRGKHQSTTMSYWLVPEEIMEDHEELARWVERSVQVSRKSKLK
jgi:DNA transformation protein